MMNSIQDLQEEYCRVGSDEIKNMIMKKKKEICVAED
jgi:hypothetical protein